MLGESVVITCEPVGMGTAAIDTGEKLLPSTVTRLGPPVPPTVTIDGCDDWNRTRLGTSAAVDDALAKR
jgi:hypothetical protein